MRAHLVLIAIVIATAAVPTVVRPAEPVAEAVAAIVRERPFAGKVEVLGPPYRDAYQLRIYTRDEPGLSADEMQRLVAALDGVNVDSVIFYGDAKLLPLLADDTLANLAGCTRLRTLRLDGNRITGSGLAALAELTHLGGLDVSSTDLSDSGCAQLPRLAALARLRMRDTKVTGRGIAALAGCRQLSELTLGREIDDRCVKELCRFGSLKKLSIQNTSISPEGARALAGCLGGQCEVETGRRRGNSKPDCRD